MSGRSITNVAASVHQRLLNFNRERGLDFTLILTRYALERWLYRLGKSECCDRFVLKGAMLFTVWAKDPFRTTRDLDLLGFGSLTGEEIREAFSRICQTHVEPDGLGFDDENMTVEPIREGEEYQGQRVRLYARMGNIRISLQIDVGMGDALWPEPEMIDYPTLLDMPAPKIKAYRRETVVAEKLEAMVSLAKENRRRFTPEQEKVYRVVCKKALIKEAEDKITFSLRGAIRRGKHKRMGMEEGEFSELWRQKMRDRLFGAPPKGDGYPEELTQEEQKILDVATDEAKKKNIEEKTQMAAEALKKVILST